MAGQGEDFGISFKEQIGEITSQVQKAVTALLEYVTKTTSKKTSFLGDSVPIDLQVCFKKAPSRKSVVKIQLPSILVNNTYSVCLFVKDLTDKTERDFSKTVEYFQEKLLDCGIDYVSQIVPIKCLKTEMKPYEAKRNLSTQYDKFLADERIAGMLPRILGKNFYSRSKNPVQVKLTAKDLKHEIDQAVKMTLFIINGRGSNSQVRIGHVDMENEDLVKNIETAVEAIMKSAPGGPQNIRLMTLRTHDSPSIPIYLSYGNSNEVDLAEQEPKVELDEPDEVGTGSDLRVRVLPDSRMQIIDKADTGFEDKYKYDAGQERKRKKEMTWQVKPKRRCKENIKRDMSNFKTANKKVLMGKKKEPKQRNSKIKNAKKKV